VIFQAIAKEMAIGSFRTTANEAVAAATANAGETLAWVALMIRAQPDRVQRGNTRAFSG
jgi:hypothetical protein